VPYIRRYKQRHPAGLAYAISKLFVDPRTCDDFWVFNGLRGQEEVRYAIEAIPKAEFIVLDADDIVRAERLIKRKDPYDRMIKRKKEHNPVIEKIDSFEAIGIPEAAEMFSPEEERQLLEIAENKSTSFVEIANILKLLWIERSLYDKDATIATLRSLAPQRTCVIDTTDLHPNEVTHEIIGRLRELELIE
jgi:hypothetical protein